MIRAIFSLLLYLRHNFFTQYFFHLFLFFSLAHKSIPLSLPCPQHFVFFPLWVSYKELNSLSSLTVILTTHLSPSQLFMSEKLSRMQFLCLSQFLSDYLIWNDPFFLLQLIIRRWYKKSVVTSSFFLIFHWFSKGQNIVTLKWCSQDGQIQHDSIILQVMGECGFLTVFKSVHHRLREALPVRQIWNTKTKAFYLNSDELTWSTKFYW